MTPEKDNINRLRHCTREFLNSRMTEKTAADLKEIHGITLGPDATNRDALDAVFLKKAREGDPKAIAFCKMYGLLSDTEADE